jgi:hypothetical protein
MLHVCVFGNIAVSRRLMPEAMTAEKILIDGAMGFWIPHIQSIPFFKAGFGSLRGREE